MENKWKNRFHLEPETGWLNDPNGLIYYQGEYHVFYQYAYEAKGGLKHWGHVSSKNKIDWDNQGIFLYPDKSFKRGGAYSGSAIEKDGEVYFFYTGNVKLEGEYDYIHAGREHNTVLVISKDCKTVTEETVLMYNKDYPKDMTLHVRDPKVFAYEGKYYMVLGARDTGDRGLALIYESEDLRHWSYIHRLYADNPKAYMWECPDLLYIDGEWILLLSPQGASSTDKYEFQNIYSCGYFKIKGDFRKDAILYDYREIDKGFDLYAPQTFKKDDKTYMLAWLGMPDAEYTAPTIALGYQHCLSSMRELQYKDGILYMKPVEELDALFGESREVPVENALVYETESKLFDIRLTARKQDRISLCLHQNLEIIISDDELVLDFVDEVHAYGRTKRYAKIQTVESIRILVDASCVEIFANDGATIMSTRFYPHTYTGIEFHGKAIWDIKEAIGEEV